MKDFTQSTKRAGVEVLTKHFRHRLETAYLRLSAPISLLDLVGRAIPFGHHVEYQRYVNAMKSTYSFLRTTGAEYWYTPIPTGLADFAAIQHWLVVVNPINQQELAYQRERDRRVAAELERQTKERSYRERMRELAKHALSSMWTTLETQPATSWNTFYKERLTYGNEPASSKPEVGGWIHALLTAPEDLDPVFTDFSVLGIDCPGMTLIETNQGAYCLRA